MINGLCYWHYTYNKTKNIQDDKKLLIKQLHYIYNVRTTYTSLFIDK